LHRVSGPSLYNRDVCECHLSCDIGKTSAKTTLTERRETISTWKR